MDCQNFIMPRKSKIHKKRIASSKLGGEARAKMLQAAREKELAPRLKRRWTEIKNFLKGKQKTVFCPHIKIGSSQFYRLICQSLTPQQVHSRYKFYGARGQGDFFEREFEKLDSFVLQNKRKIEFRNVRSQAYTISKSYPFLCATPDFRIEYSKKGSGVWNEGLVEVKSFEGDKSKVPAGIKSDANDATWQLRTSLALFGIETGFLVYFVYDSENQEDFEIYAKEVQNDNMLDKEHERIVDGYSHYIVKLINAMECLRKEDQGAMLFFKQIQNFVSGWIKMQKNNDPLLSITGLERPSWKCAYGLVFKRAYAKTGYRPRGRPRIHPKTSLRNLSVRPR